MIGPCRQKPRLFRRQMGGISTQRADTGRGALGLFVVPSFWPCRRVDSPLFWYMIAENVPRQRRPREVRQNVRAPPRHQAAVESHLDLSRYLHASSGPRKGQPARS